jgi:hypothetical protein
LKKYWKRPKQNSAIKILAEKLPAPALYDQMQKLGYKWNFRYQSWEFSNYVYWNLPEHIYSRTQLKKINRVPKKGAKGFQCWNGIGYIPVWDIADTREKRKLTEKQRLALEHGRAERQTEWQIYHFLTEHRDTTHIVYGKWIYFTMPKVFAAIRNSNGLLVRGKIEKRILHPHHSVERFTSYLKISIVAQTLCKILHYRDSDYFKNAKFQIWEEL